MEKFMKAKNFDKLKDVKDFHVRMEQITGERHLKMDYYFLKDYHHRLNTYERGGMHIVYDGEKSWIKVSVAPPAPGNPDLNEQFDMMYEFFFTPTFGKIESSSFSLEGLKTFGGETYYFVSMKDKEGLFTDLYIDTVSFDLRRVVKFIDFMGQSIPFEMYFDEYKVVNDIRIPFKIIATRVDEPLTYQLEEIKFDIGMNRYDFRRPE